MRDCEHAPYTLRYMLLPYYAAYDAFMRHVAQMPLCAMLPRLMFIAAGDADAATRRHISPCLRRLTSF